LKVTQKTAWFMLHRVRVAYGLADTEPLSGEVEADETFVGGKTRKTAFSRAGFRSLAHGPATGKTTVFGMVERPQPGHKHNRVRAMVVANHKASTLLPKIRENILPGSILYTDALRSYAPTREEYVHHIIDHAVSYCEGRVHTNTIENFWSCLKRTLHGTYIAPRAFHLDAYLDEQVFRFNERDDNDGGRFAKATKAVDGKRLTYRTLIARNTKRRA
jgi:transposase-like protein